MSHTEQKRFHVGGLMISPAIIPLGEKRLADVNDKDFQTSNAFLSLL